MSGSAERIRLRPLGVRVVGGVVAVIFPLLIGVVAYALPPEVRAKFDLIQLGTLCLFALVIVVLTWSLLRCRVDLTESGLVVVNGFARHEYVWPQVVAATMAEGHPWAVLDLSDGTSVAAVGIQAADGERARAQIQVLREHIRRYGTHADGATDED